MKILSRQHFEALISEYSASLSELDEQKDIIELAEQFIKKLDLTNLLYDFLIFIYNKTHYSTVKLKDWYIGSLTQASKISINKNGNLIIEISNIKIEYDQNFNIAFYETDYGPYDDPNKDYHKKIIITKLGKIVFEAEGSDYGKKDDPKIVPEHIYLRMFKPSNWLFTLYNFLINFEEQKSSLEKLYSLAVQKNAAELAREKFSPQKD